MTTAPAIRPSAGERWLDAGAPIGRVSRTMALVVGVSLLAHLAVVGSIGVAGRAAVLPPTEIAVEIVHEMPKPAPEAAKSEPEAKPQVAKSEPAKPAPAPKPEPVKPEAAKPEVAKPEAAKREAAKPDVTKVAKSEPWRRAAAKPEHKAAVAPRAADEAAEERKLASLQQELESLKAEQVRLQAERAAESSPSATPVALRDTGLGLLPNSFQSVALPNSTDAGADAVSYQQLVFSALAKAKGFGRRQGIPGTSGVRFSVDAAGKLVAVELVRWSGVPALDSEALDIVRRATFPPPPQGAQRTFVANVNFEVERAR